jgi:hypothetical protein
MSYVPVPVSDGERGRLQQIIGSRGYRNVYGLQLRMVGNPFGTPGNA